MPYDEILSERMRNALKDTQGVVEKRMMGGVCFMVNGHMVGGAKREKNGRRRFMFRVGKDNMTKALEDPIVHAVHFGERQLGGFVHIEEADCDDQVLKHWLSICLDFIATLPPK